MKKLILKWLFGTDIKVYEELLSSHLEVLNRNLQLIDELKDRNNSIIKYGNTILGCDERALKLMKTCEELSQINEELLSKIEKSKREIL